LTNLNQSINQSINPPETSQCQPFIKPGCVAIQNEIRKTLAKLLFISRVTRALNSQQAHTRAWATFSRLAVQLWLLPVHGAPVP